VTESERSTAQGPLSGLRVIELASLGPGPHAAMMLGDLGADVVRVEAPQSRGLQLGPPGSVDSTLRGRRTVTADLRTAEGLESALSLVDHADVLVEGMRPGVAERLGIGPEPCLRRNPRLVYGRITGWGQSGPLAGEVGHDLNYLGLSGALRAIGPADAPPPPPLNLAADFGGGSMLLMTGILAALWERERSGLGQVVDAAMVDGAIQLSQFTLALRGMGSWNDERSANLLDGGAPFYSAYRCADGEFVAVGALEERFFAALLDGLGIEPGSLPAQDDRDGWPAMRERFRQVFAQRSRDEWCEHFAGTDACVTPVLGFEEAARHPHNLHRANFREGSGGLQAASAPRFSRSVPVPTEIDPTRWTADRILESWSAESD